MFRSSRMVVLALAAAFALVPVVQADDEPALKIEFKVEGISPKTVDAVKTALEGIDGAGEVMTGADGVYQVSVEAGKSIDLNSIGKAIASAKGSDGPDLRLDIKSLMLSGMFMVAVEGDAAAGAKALSSTEGFSAEAGKEAGTITVKVTSSKPKSAMDLIQALGQAKLKLGNITWAAGAGEGGEGCGEGGCGEGGCGGGGCGGGGK